MAGAYLNLVFCLIECNASRDAGVTVQASDPAVNAMMKDIGRLLNLKQCGFYKS